MLDIIITVISLVSLLPLTSAAALVTKDYSMFCNSTLELETESRFSLTQICISTFCTTFLTLGV
jgi:hypothetical protein